MKAATKPQAGTTFRRRARTAIGITDLQKPDYGDPVPVEEGELPVFWACGVTPQAAIAAAKPPFAITHSPGCMLVTDLKNRELALF